MTSKPPLYLQETPDSCVPACLRMVLAGLGMTVTEAELRRRCDCTIFGTTAFQAVEAVRQLGFSEARKTTLSLAQISECIDQETYPIVYLQMMPIDRVRMLHALVVIQIDTETLTLLDPSAGERVLAKSLFLSAFQAASHLAILVAFKTD